MTKELGIKIRELRHRRGLTLRDLSAQIGTSFQLICRWENGQHQPSMKYLIKLSEFFSVNVGEFINASGIKTSAETPRGGDPMKEIILGNGQMKRADDRDYSMAKPMRLRSPDVVDGRPIVKILLLRDVFKEHFGDMDQMVFMRVETPAFVPMIIPGSILLVDQGDIHIRDGFYILRFDGEFLLRQMRPLSPSLIRIIHSADSNNGWTDQGWEEIKPFVTGRVVAMFKRI